MSIFRRKRKLEENDLGFGTRITSAGERLINKDGSFNILRTGVKIWTPYQSLVEMPWSRFFVLITIFYCVVNAFFASIFVAIGVDCLKGVEPQSIVENFANAFFFSVQTFTTVGYGAVSPVGTLANIIASIDALVGLMSFALATGLFFARFSKPKAQIIYSKNAIITPYNNGTSFQFRIANLRNNKIIDLEAKVNMTWVEEIDGLKRRRFSLLDLEREKIFLFPLNWTIVHPITKRSPLYGKSMAQLKKMQAEFLVLIEGYDETFAQKVHTNNSYTSDEIIWDVRFERMYRPEQGQTLLELDKIHHYSSVTRGMEEEE